MRATQGHLTIIRGKPITFVERHAKMNLQKPLPSSLKKEAKLYHFDMITEGRDDRRFPVLFYPLPWERILIPARLIQTH
jgi:hypothetical protein